VVRSRKAVVTKRMVLGELPDLLEALDRGEFTQAQQQQIREGVTTGRASWSDYGGLPTDFEDEDGCREIALFIDDYWPWPEPDWDDNDDGYAQDGCADEKMLRGDTDTLLVHAARRGRMRSIAFLLELGADVTGKSGFGETPLFAACLEGHVGAVRILLDFTPPAGASRRGLPLRAFKSTFTWAHPITEYTVLAAACTSTDARGLLAGQSQGGNISFARATPALHQAQHAVVRCLLEEYHVRVQEHTIENEHNGLCQHAFYQLLTSYRVNEPQKLATIELFLRHGADPNQRVCDIWDQTTRVNPCMTIFHALCHAVLDVADGSFHKAIAPFLPAQQIHGWIPGTAAVGAYPAVACLLQFGADPEAGASNGTSPISFAWTQRNSELERLLSWYKGAKSAPRRVPLADPPSHPSSRKPVRAMASSSAGPAHVASSSAESPQRGERKRKLRSTPMEVRAEKAGVADEMQPLPSDKDAPDYKNARKKVQIANHQIVARAEERLSKGNRKPRRSTVTS
jgi:hypothetical protein